MLTDSDTDWLADTDSEVLTEADADSDTDWLADTDSDMLTDSETD